MNSTRIQQSTMDERDEILADEVLGALLAKRVGDAQRLLRE